MKATSGTVTAGKLPLFRVHSFQSQDKLDHTLFIWCRKASPHPPPVHVPSMQTGTSINSCSSHSPFVQGRVEFWHQRENPCYMLLLHFKTSHIHQIQDNTSRKLLQSEPTSCRGPLSSHLPTSVLFLPRPA